MKDDFKIGYLIKRSLELDFRYLFGVEEGLTRKLEFIIKKYAILLREFVFGNSAKRTVRLHGIDYNYDDRYGISFLQSVYVDSAFLKNYISEGCLVVDVGANIGQFRFFCTDYLRAEKVYSFEPIASTFSYLKRNFPVNSYNFAISQKSELTFYVSKKTSLISSSVMALFESGMESSYAEESVRGRKLGQVADISALPKINLLKIDAEGAEYDVLKASVGILDRVDFVYVEASVSRTSVANITDILYLLRNKFKLIKVGRNYNTKSGETEALDLLLINNRLLHT